MIINAKLYLYLELFRGGLETNLESPLKITIKVNRNTCTFYVLGIEFQAKNKQIFIFIRYFNNKLNYIQYIRLIRLFRNICQYLMFYSY